MSIEESNKLIAEFMGRNHQNLAGFIEQYEYHTSWDWLMPVVDRIESLKLGDCVLKDSYMEMMTLTNAMAEVKIQHSACVIDLFGTMKVYEAFIEVIEESKIESTYKAVVEFIQWYNKQK